MKGIHVEPSWLYTDREGKTCCRPPRIAVATRLIHLGAWSVWWVSLRKHWCLSHSRCNFTKFEEWRIETPRGFLALERTFR